MLSKKTQYGFKALTYLAERGAGQPVLIAEIAEKKNIPRKFLETILLELNKAGLLKSRQGTRGGYCFVRDPKEITLAEVMRLLDGPIALLPCVSLHFYQKCNDCTEETCGLNRMMVEVRDATLQLLEHTTIHDLVGAPDKLPPAHKEVPAQLPVHKYL